MTKFSRLSSLILTGLFVAGISKSFAQGKDKDDSALMRIYRETPARINDLVHTKLSVSFDYKKRYMYGREWVTLKPHFYPTDTLRLDAKGMDIKEIALIRNGKNIPLRYAYQDSLSLAIHLDKTYRNNESYKIFIAYTSKPNLLKAKGSAAINDAKGLYFINPDSVEAGKPVQIWTQGESESSSAWFPTIDKPEQKTTDEISMTVPSKYVTLSNGRMASQKNNGNGTRTDTWIMDLPHSPYLFMMAVGNFRIYRDHWRGKEVSYYLEPKYAPYAKEIFGMTPELIGFYSKITGLDYPWNKYAQIVVRDYVSGAMENTTATLHGDYVQGTHRELMDSYYDDGRSTIAHELFHQWFGDYVTCESWSNLTVNESFANFSETLWGEYKYGKDEGDAHNYADLLTYLGDPNDAQKSLVRFHYADKEDVFDNVTYQKGGRILNMLRNYLGNDAFYRGLNIYLKTNAFKTGEAQQLRLALEEASGRDLNWFFNEWYYGAGHPVFDIDYKWEEAEKKEFVYITQKQQGQLFKIPMAIDIYSDGKKERRKVWIDGRSDTLTFGMPVKPDLVNVDGDKILLCQKTDNKTLSEFAFQQINAGLYVDRLEAVEAAQKTQSDPIAQQILINALKDKYYGLRIKAITALDLKNKSIYGMALPVLIRLAKTDENTLVRATALKTLGELKDRQYMPIYHRATSSLSYAVQAAGLISISEIDSTQALQIGRQLQKDNGGALTKALVQVYELYGSDNEWPFVYKFFKNAPPYEQYRLLPGIARMTSDIKNPQFVQQSIPIFEMLGIKYKQFGVAPGIVRLLSKMEEGRKKFTDEGTTKVIDTAIQVINNAK